MEINLKNIEEQIFFNSEIKKLLPDFQNLFYQWEMSKTYPGFGNLGKNSLSKFMDSLERTHIDILEKYFGETVYIKNVNPNIVQDISLNNANLCESYNLLDFCCYRDKDAVHLTFWR